MIEFFNLKCCQKLNQSNQSIKLKLPSTQVTERDMKIRNSQHSTASQHSQLDESIINILQESITDKILQNIKSKQQIINLNEDCQTVCFPSKKSIKYIPSQHFLNIQFKNAKQSCHNRQSNVRLASSMPPQVVFPLQVTTRLVQTQEFFPRKFRTPQNDLGSIKRIQNLEGQQVAQFLKSRKLR